MKIKSIKRTGDFRTLRVEPWNYTDQTIRWYQETGEVLPTRAEALRIGDLDQLRVLLHPIVITIELDTGQWYSYKFEAGFMWDLASVPRFARWAIDNDDIYIQEAAIVHDANFSAHFLGDSVEAIEETNELFEQMIRYRGKRFRAWLAHKAVNSVIGHAIYQHMPERRGAMTRSRVAFSSSMR
jgi:hypothetical protein